MKVIRRRRCNARNSTRIRSRNRSERKASLAHRGGQVCGSELPRGIAYFSLGAPTPAGDWLVRAAMSEGDLSSWIIAGSFVSRRDPVRHVMARLAVGLYWFHPLAWWLERKLAVTAEHTCDEAAARVFFGATVTYKDAAGDEHIVRIVGIDEIDLARRYISWMSPLARALMKGAPGDRVVVRAPTKSQQVEIVDVEYLPIPMDPFREPPGAEAPLHVHHREDEAFWVLDGSVTIEPCRPGVDGALGRLLGIVAEAQKEGTWSRLKACPWDTCRWAFYDHSRNRSGVWCNMAVCGNRAKVRSYRERHGSS